MLEWERDNKEGTEKTMTDKYKFFWDTMGLCDQDFQDDDDQALKPVIRYLLGQEDKKIFEFDDLMSELLYELDREELADQCQERDPRICADPFLYSRCAALINGPEYYERVKKGMESSVWDMEFEALLYVPQKAWALKHRSFVDEYPHHTLWCTESGSNPDGWK